MCNVLLYYCVWWILLSPILRLTAFIWPIKCYENNDNQPHWVTPINDLLLCFPVPSWLIQNREWKLTITTFILYIYTSGVVTLFYLRIGVSFPTLLWINKLSQIFTFRNIILTFSCPWIEVTMVTMCNIQCPVFVTCDIIRLPQFVRERIVSIWVTNTGR
jgi:hypothetical protein